MHTRIRCAFFAALMLLIAASTSTTFATTILVNSAEDTVADDGQCTLREAIIAANTDTASGASAGECAAGNGSDIIAFNVSFGSVVLIQPTSELPAAKGPVDFDGQNGCFERICVHLDGSNAGDANGLVLAGDASNRVEVEWFSITGFAGAGVKGQVGSTGNSVGNSYIGLMPDGATAAGNFVGVEFADAGGSVGTSVVSGNETTGILYSGNVRSNNVINCLVGTNAGGSAAVPNGTNGITIGDPTTAQDGPADSQVRFNVISGNGAAGLFIVGPGTRDVVANDNMIGTDATGTFAVPNQNGIVIDNSVSALIGTIGDLDPGLISGNLESGIVIRGAAAVENQVLGNWIGTDITGQQAIPNGQGVLITDGAAFSDIRGNIISGNGDPATEVGPGVVIAGGATRNSITQNQIGEGKNGVSLPNANNGILIFGPSNTVERNTIAGNLRAGIEVAGASGTRIDRNWIEENASFGVWLNQGATSTLVGRIWGNTITQNGAAGVFISGVGTDENVVANNWIGTNAGGDSALGNGADGVAIADQASNNRVGGESAGDSNTIANNGAAGVAISGGTGNAVLGNSTYANAGLGIDLGSLGATGNDVDDPDDGANHLQNSPDLISASLDAGDLFVSFSVDSAPQNSVYDLRVEFFLVDAAGEEGETFLGAGLYDAASAGMTHGVQIAGPLSVSPGDMVVATATDAEGNTSEFATPVMVSEGVTVEDKPNVPVEHALRQNYPNPFNARTAFQVAMPQPGHVVIDLFDVMGRRVLTVLNEEVSAGWQTIEVDTADLPSGTYVYRMISDGFRQSRTMSVVR